MSKILNLKQYDLVFTTSFEHMHGVSGHLYEMIEYYYVCDQNAISTAVLLSDGTTKELFEKAITEKYNFTVQEIADIMLHVVEGAQPKVISCKNLCVVDGAPRFAGCTVYADNVLLLRCSATDYSYFHKHKTIKRTHLLQDFDLYTERYYDLDITLVDYTKKILWTRYKQPTAVNTNTALMYLTTNCRALDASEIQTIIDQTPNRNYLIATNDVDKYKHLASEYVTIESAPVQNIFDQFDTYIYTSIPRQFDCSPRFIVECAVFGKQVEYEIDYRDPGIECRQRAIARGVETLLLTDNDAFVGYVQRCIKSQ